MDIEYDPTEEEADDIDGLLDYDGLRDQWRILCPEHGEIDRGPDGSIASHDAMIYRWVDHMAQAHHGDGRLTGADRMMLIGEDGRSGVR